MNIRASRVIWAIQFCSHNTFNAYGSNSCSFAVREQKSSCQPSACDAHSHVNASRLSVGLRSYGSRRESPIVDRAAEIESDIPPRQLVQDSDVDIASVSGDCGGLWSLVAWPHPCYLRRFGQASGQ